jgi:hypothetical protein
MEHGIQDLLQFAPVCGAGTFIPPFGQRHLISTEMVSEFAS